MFAAGMALITAEEHQEQDDFGSSQEKGAFSCLITEPDDGGFQDLKMNELPTPLSNQDHSINELELNNVEGRVDDTWESANNKEYVLQNVIVIPETPVENSAKTRLPARREPTQICELQQQTQ